MRLTDSKIKSLKAKQERYIAWETGSAFGIRVFPSGIKSFVVMYRFDGKARMMTLGKYPQKSLVSARKEANQAFEKVSKGIDPASEIKEQKLAHKTAFTVQNLVDEYIEKWAKVKKTSWESDQRYLEKEVIPRWGRRKSESITRRDIALLLDAIVDRGAPVSANRTLAVIQKMFNFAIARGILQDSPCVLFEKPAEETPRERHLDAREIKIFWNKLDECDMSEKIGLAFKLLLVTGQRRVEVSSAEWVEFDLFKGWWTIPGAKVKNGQTHRVPLSKMALELLEEVKALSGESAYLFPSPIGDKPITERSITRAIRNNESVFDLPHFSPHDLRRTVYTFMEELEIDPEIISRFFNHSKKGMRKVYGKFAYDKQKKQAVEKWNRKLKIILTDEEAKIIELKK